MYSYKVILLGAMNVGKTAIVNKYIYNVFDPAARSTIGANYFKKDIIVKNGKISLCLWDTAGNSSFNSLVPLYYKNANAALVVFDLTEVESFKRAEEIIEDLKRSISHDIFIILIGNKSDMKNQRISVDDANLLALKHNIIYKTCSALLGDNINDIFKEVVNNISIRANPFYHETSTLLNKEDIDPVDTACCYK
jgi:small GTP-binding protein